MVERSIAMRLRDDEATGATSPAGQLESGNVRTPLHPVALRLLHQGPPSAWAPVGPFLRHFVEMCAAMCLGAILLSVLVFEGAALLGYPDLVRRLPELSTLVIAMNLSLPMAAWMRLRATRGALP
jgi:hypothetical protein